MRNSASFVFSVATKETFLDYRFVDDFLSFHIFVTNAGNYYSVRRQRLKKKVSSLVFIWSNKSDGSWNDKNLDMKNVIDFLVNR